MPDGYGPTALGPHFVDLGRVSQPEEHASAIPFVASAPPRVTHRRPGERYTSTDGAPEVSSAAEQYS
ncbi:hypothetical protein [Streptomyces sp. DH41]|uniref:hypothetical protein n=1 Tax=Streptomyces sp. DH41 TaxID=3040125 RepID=UPI002442A7C0|nr:hypothetical protein [Streptomyces sp. DH41]MDG9724346.1 hypothetical protein [Streptomyces sp. DH41]